METTVGDHPPVPLKQLHVLPGNCEPILTKMVTTLVSMKVGDQAKVSFSDSGDLAEFIGLSDARSFDLVILALNNLLLKNNDRSGSRIDRDSKAIERIKSRGNARVIALSALCDGPEFPDRVSLSHVDFFFTMPFQPAETRAAIRRCLSLEKSRRNP